MKITKSLAIALKKMLSLKMGEVATDKATLVWDGDADLEEGFEVFVIDADGNAVPAEDGDYVTEDGKTIKVADGKVAEILDPKAEVADEPVEEKSDIKQEENTDVDPVEEPEKEETQEEDRVAKLEARVEEIYEGLNKFLNAMTALEERISVVEEKLASVEAPAADPVDEQPEVKQSKNILSYLRK